MRLPTPFKLRSRSVPGAEEAIPATLSRHAGNRRDTLALLAWRHELHAVASPFRTCGRRRRHHAGRRQWQSKRDVPHPTSR